MVPFVHKRKETGLKKISSFLFFFLTISDCIYHFCEGHDATQHAAFGEAAHIAITLRMHEEAAYEGLDPIESEIRRRTFWLLFDGASEAFTFFSLLLN
jgi:hypothetical protein